MPGYWSFDGVLRRTLSEHIEAQVNVNNLLNRSFIDLPHPSHLVPGAGRSALFGINYKF